MVARSVARRSVLAGLVLVLGLTACTPDTATDGPPTAENPPAVGDRSAKPEVVLPEEVPTGFVIEDVVLGEGDVAGDGDTVTVHLVAYSLATGQEIDSTWELAAPRRVPLVDGGAVPGFLQGVIGMAVGGRRSLVVPAELAYGDVGAPPAVGPGEALLFVVDVLAIDPGRG